MGRAFNAVVCGVALSAGAAVAHNKGLWSSSVVDGNYEDQLFRFGSLPCEARRPLPIDATKVQIDTFIQGCDYDEWCVTDPVFSDQSGTTQAVYQVCASVDNLRISSSIGGKAIAVTNLEAYPKIPTQEASGSDGGMTEIVSAVTPLDSSKLHNALEDSPEACTIFTEGVAKIMQESLNEAAAFTVRVAIRVSQGRDTACDDPTAAITTDDRGPSKS